MKAHTFIYFSLLLFVMISCKKTSKAYTYHVNGTLQDSIYKDIVNEPEMYHYIVFNKDEEGILYFEIRKMKKNCHHFPKLKEFLSKSNRQFMIKDTLIKVMIEPDFLISNETVMETYLDEERGYFMIDQSLQIKNYKKE